MLIELFGGSKKMELLVAGDSYLYKTTDGNYWCKTIYGYEFWTRYLDVFDSIAIVSRTELSDFKEVEGYLKVNGPNLRVIELPDMRGMKQYISKYYAFQRAAKKAVKNADCALIRLPSISASMILKYYKKSQKPYALEVVADPYDAYSSNKAAQLYYTCNLKKAAKNATGVSYVTKYFLQEKYPSHTRLFPDNKNHFETYYSTINLDESYFAEPKKFNENKRKFTIVHTANSINNDGKGHDTLINVIKNLRENKYNVHAIFIGDGDKKPYYENLVSQMDLTDYIEFTGLLSSPMEVREVLLQGDIFVFPTKAEGLPRAIIEAMAVGLPVLSTPVNGIPELLNKKYMYDPSDVEGFTKKLMELFTDVSELENMSKTNIITAEQYTLPKLTLRRKEFYSQLRSIAEKENY